jgi:hypothetical protein
MIPQEVQTARTFFLVSGIINILYFLGWGGGTIIGGLATCGIGCITAFFPFITVVAAIFDFMAYNKLNNLNMPGTYGTVKTAAILDIITIASGNVVSMIFGILILTNLDKNELQVFFKERNIY